MTASIFNGDEESQIEKSARGCACGQAAGTPPRPNNDLTAPHEELAAAGMTSQMRPILRVGEWLSVGLDTK